MEVFRKVKRIELEISNYWYDCKYNNVYENIG